MRLILLTISPEASVFERFFRRLKIFIKNRFFYYGLPPHQLSFKNPIKLILNFRFIKYSNWCGGGPSAVLDSLRRGLKSLGIEYQLNPNVGDISEDAIVGVLSDVRALRWAIEAKKSGKIKKIIAGPNLVLMPVDADNILLDENIDAVLVPSQWVKDFWVSFNKSQNSADIKQNNTEENLQRHSVWYQRNSASFEDKIRIWPAGVEVPDVIARPPQANEAIPNCLIYKKNCDENLYGKILQFLELKGIVYKIIKYGKYKKEDYWKMLNKAQFMICLQESESQGLALCEAWARNVPTLVWSRGYCEVRGQRWNDAKIGAPYLTDEAGMFFKDEDDFKHKLPVFLEKLGAGQFRPAEYALLNFCDKAAAKKYMTILQE